MNDASALLYALGLTRESILAQEPMAAVRSGKLGDRRLHDISRSHATLALSLSDSPDAVGVLAGILGGEDARARTRRSAAIALGIVSATGPCPGPSARRPCAPSPGCSRRTATHWSPGTPPSAWAAPDSRPGSTCSFEIDAATNAYGLTVATRNVVIAY